MGDDLILYAFAKKFPCTHIPLNDASIQTQEKRKDAANFFLYTMYNEAKWKFDHIITRYNKLSF